MSDEALPHPGSCRGRLLVATPPLDDPNFDHTVVYVLQHDADGAVGVVINRATSLRLPDVVDRWQDVLCAPAVVFEGGPVETTALIALAVVDGDVVSLDLEEDPAIETAGAQAVRVFRGYSGWGALQLDGELAAGGWMVFDALPSDLVDPEPDDLWRTVIRRQGGRLAWVADAPDDLSLN